MKHILAILALTSVTYAADAAVVKVPGDSIRVVDGDTVALGTERLRFALTDAPELGRAACEEERRTALRAKNRLKTLLIGRKISIIYLEKNDKYNRPIVVLLSSEGIPEITLLNEGLTDLYSPRRRSVEQHRMKWCPIQ